VWRGSRNTRSGVDRGSVDHASDTGTDSGTRNRKFGRYSIDSTSGRRVRSRSIAAPDRDAALEPSEVGLISNARAHLLALPSKLAFQLAGVSDAGEVHATLTNAIHEALSELAGDANIAGAADNVESALAIAHVGNDKDQDASRTDES
jgi:hypothetical protein